MDSLVSWMGCRMASAWGSRIQEKAQETNKRIQRAASGEVVSMNDRLKAKLATCRNLWRDKAKRWLVKPHPQAEKGKLTPAQWMMTLPCLLGFGSALAFAVLTPSVYLTGVVFAVLAVCLWLWMWLMAWQDKRETKQKRHSRGA